MTRYTIIDDTDPGLVYTGDWRLLQAPLDAKTPEYNGKVHATNDPNATVSYNFTGSAIDIFGTIDSPATYGYPNASFTVTPISTGGPTKHLNQSGYMPAIEDLTAATSHLQLFKSGNLSPGDYAMSIVTDGVQQGGPTFYFDFLRFAVPNSGVYDSIIVDDTDAQWSYSGNWVPGPHVGDYLYTGRETPHEGGSAELGFYGTKISIYGTLNGNYNADTPIAYINVDGEPTHTVVAQNVTNQPLESGVPLRNQIIFSTSKMGDLGTTKRTVTISVPPIIATGTGTGTESSGSPASGTSTPAPTISNPSWFLDYAIYGPYSAGATSSPSTATSSSAPNSPPVGPITGVVIGALALVAITAAVFVVWRRRKQQKRQVEVPDAYPNNPVEMKTTESSGSRNKGAAWSHLARENSAAPLNSGGPGVKVKRRGVNSDDPRLSSLPAWMTPTALSPGTALGSSAALPLETRGTVPSTSHGVHRADHRYTNTEGGPWGEITSGYPSQSGSAGDHNAGATGYSNTGKARFDGRAASNEPSAGSTRPISSTPLTIEEDSGIRIPMTAPPVYTPD